jgi:hypothetical protein
MRRDAQVETNRNAQRLKAVWENLLNIKLFVETEACGTYILVNCYRKFT